MSTTSKWNAENLPPWFREVQSAQVAQPSLFTDDVPSVLAELRVSVDALERWHRQGWLSFGPARRDPLEPQDVNEVRFVRDVVQSGLSEAHIAYLLDQLPRPLNFNPEEVAYSFSLGWVAAAHEPECDTDEIVDVRVQEWLDQLADNGDLARLTELRDRIDGLLLRPATEPEESEE